MLVSRKRWTDLTINMKQIRILVFFAICLIANPATSSPLNPRELAQDDFKWLEFTVGAKENILSIFLSAGLDSGDFNDLLNNSEYGVDLISVKQGERILIRKSKSENLMGLRYIIAPGESLLFERRGSGFRSSRESRSFDPSLKFATATIASSLFQAGKNAGIPTKLLVDLASIFDGTIDFVRDTRKGDTFAVLYKEEHGAFEIVAASYTNKGIKHEGYRYVFESNHHGYFTADGRNLQSAFLQAPLDYTRISSGFNPNRMHPISKRVKAHRGVDYAAPKGTPVYASNNGIVIESGKTKPNGNFVVIEHGNQYKTKYLHLDKRHVDVGDIVSRRQTIGEVGSTGYATGPHLHYEFLINDKHLDPRKAVKKFPSTEKIPHEELDRFRWYTQYPILLFKGRNHQFQLASADKKS